MAVIIIKKKIIVLTFLSVILSKAFKLNYTLKISVCIFSSNIHMDIEFGMNIR